MSEINFASQAEFQLISIATNTESVTILDRHDQSSVSETSDQLHSPQYLAGCSDAASHPAQYAGLSPKMTASGFSSSDEEPVLHPDSLPGEQCSGSGSSSTFSTPLSSESTANSLTMRPVEQNMLAQAPSRCRYSCQRGCDKVTVPEPQRLGSTLRDKSTSNS
ncbi:hypothetical protein MAJ_09401, partial [Metarhizium majus ARSEF 297]